MALKNIYARIPQVYFERLSALAEIRNQSTSELIREILCAYFETKNLPEYCSKPNCTSNVEYNTESKELINFTENFLESELDW